MARKTHIWNYLNLNSEKWCDWLKFPSRIHKASRISGKNCLIDQKKQEKPPKLNAQETKAELGTIEEDLIRDLFKFPADEVLKRASKFESKQTDDTGFPKN